MMLQLRYSVKWVVLWTVGTGHSAGTAEHHSPEPGIGCKSAEDFVCSCLWLVHPVSPCWTLVHLMEVILQHHVHIFKKCHYLLLAVLIIYCQLHSDLYLPLMFSTIYPLVSESRTPPLLSSAWTLLDQSPRALWESSLGVL